MLHIVCELSRRKSCVDLSCLLPFEQFAKQEVLNSGVGLSLLELDVHSHNCISMMNVQQRQRVYKVQNNSICGSPGRESNLLYFPGVLAGIILLQIEFALLQAIMFVNVTFLGLQIPLHGNLLPDHKQNRTHPSQQTIIATHTSRDEAPPYCCQGACPNVPEYCQSATSESIAGLTHVRLSLLVHKGILKNDCSKSFAFRLVS